MRVHKQCIVSIQDLAEACVVRLFAAAHAQLCPGIMDEHRHDYDEQKRRERASLAHACVLRV
jgi:hypothetical protein